MVSRAYVVWVLGYLTDPKGWILKVMTASTLLLLAATVVVVVQIYMSSGGLALNMDMLPLTQPWLLLTEFPSAEVLFEYL